MDIIWKWSLNVMKHATTIRRVKMTSIERMRAIREEITGIPQEEILKMTLDAERNYVASVTGKNIIDVECLNENSLNRGNPYMATGRIASKEFIDKFVGEIKEKWKKR